MSEPPPTTITTDHTDDTYVAMAPGARVTFNYPRFAYVGVLFLLVCLIPVGGVLTEQTFRDGSYRLLGFAIIIIPVVVATAFVIRRKTVVTTEGITAVHLLRQTAMTWSEIAGISLKKRGSLAAVRTDGSEVKLPALSFGHLSQLSAASDGRIPDLREPSESESPRP